MYQFRTLLLHRWVGICIQGSEPCGSDGWAATREFRIIKEMKNKDHGSAYSNVLHLGPINLWQQSRGTKTK